MSQKNSKFENSQKITFFHKIWNFGRKFFKQKKNKYCFLILVIHNWTRALQSSLILRKKSEKISKNIFKKTFFSSKNLKILKNIFFAEKNAIILVLPSEEISLLPELSTPPRFRIQGGGVPWAWHTYTAAVVVVVVVVVGRYFPFLIKDCAIIFATHW